MLGEVSELWPTLSSLPRMNNGHRGISNRRYTEGVQTICPSDFKKKVLNHPPPLVFSDCFAQSTKLL